MRALVKAKSAPGLWLQEVPKPAPGPGDQHILADQIEGQRGVDRVAQGIEDRPDLVG